MSLRLEAIHHVAVIATDYARSKHFYAELLGLPVIREHKREADWKIDFQLGEAELELFVKPDAPPRKSYPEAQGLRHLAFRVSRLRKPQRPFGRPVSAWSPSAQTLTPERPCASSLTRTGFRSNCTNERSPHQKNRQQKKRLAPLFFVSN